MEPQKSLTMVLESEVTQVKPGFRYLWRSSGAPGGGDGAWLGAREGQGCAVTRTDSRRQEVGGNSELVPKAGSAWHPPHCPGRGVQGGVESHLPEPLFPLQAG